MKCYKNCKCPTVENGSHFSFATYSKIPSRSAKKGFFSLNSLCFLHLNGRITIVATQLTERGNPVNVLWYFNEIYSFLSKSIALLIHILLLHIWEKMHTFVQHLFICDIPELRVFPGFTIFQYKKIFFIINILFKIPTKS